MLETPSSNSELARMAMIDSQLRTSGVTAPRVLARMNAVPREDFVPETAKATAYVDRAIALGDGNWLPAPLVQAMLLQEAAPVSGDMAIVVDGGSGYLAELLRPLVANVAVLSPAAAVLNDEGETGRSLLLIDGAIEALPAALIARLADNARVVTGLVENGVTRIAIGRKAGEAVALQAVADLGMPRLAAFDAPPAWAF